MESHTSLFRNKTEMLKCFLSFSVQNGFTLHQQNVTTDHLVRFPDRESVIIGQFKSDQIIQKDTADKLTGFVCNVNRHDLA